MRVGIICDLNHQFNIAISNYYVSLRNIFSDVRLVRGIEDLDSIQILFIGNEHFPPHKSIWNNQNFIERVNHLGIEVIVWAGEQIYNPNYPQNLEIQRSIESFQNLRQVLIDVNDSKILHKPVIGTPFSKEFQSLKKNCKKKNRMIFIGSLALPWYQKRVDIISELKKFIDFDVYENKFRTYKEYIELLSEYRFVLNPHSMNLNGLTGRFYESLLVNSVPVQQIYDDTLDYYTTESNYQDVIYFQEPEELIERIDNFEFDESFSCPNFEEVLTDYFKREFGMRF